MIIVSVKRISGVVEEHNKDVSQKVVDVPEQIGATIDKTDNRVCHRLPTRRNGHKCIIVKFVSRQTKHLIRGNKKKLMEITRDFSLMIM